MLISKQILFKPTYLKGRRKAYKGQTRPAGHNDSQRDDYRLQYSKCGVPMDQFTRSKSEIASYECRTGANRAPTEGRPSSTRRANL